MLSFVRLAMRRAAGILCLTVADPPEDYCRNYCQALKAGIYGG